MKSMIQKFIYINIVAYMILVSVNLAAAYDDKVMHPAINEESSRRSINLENILNELDYDSGVIDTLSIDTSKRIFEYFREGGENEDHPLTRTLNHFHDPLETWDNAGMTGGVSSVIWSQNQEGVWGGEWSWQNAREYYFDALTGVDNDSRETSLADTFRALGQLMHLVSDSSVPAHVRNDAHVLPMFGIGTPHYETWAKNNHNIITYTGYSIDPSIFNEAVSNNNAPVPISSLWDQDKYQQSMGPDWIPDSTAIVGIAEFTNANFFSKDTILQINNYPHPSISETNFFDIRLADLETIDAEDGQIDRRIYISKSTGEPIQHLAAISYLHIDLLDLNIYQSTGFRLFYLDDRCFEEYASHLVPMAVGYSAGLLNYFFRGELHIALLVPSVDTLSTDFGNESDTGIDIDRVAVFIQNNSTIGGAIEPIGAGTLTLTIGYTDTKGTPDPADDTTEYESAGETSVTSIPETGSGSYFAVLFTLTNTIHADIAEDLTYYFAFRGQLGNEEDAVIGRAVGAPVLKQVSPDEGIVTTEVTITGNNLPIIDGPYPVASEDVRFHHDLNRPYSANVENRTDTEITVDVPDTAGLQKPDYGGLRVRNVLATGETIYSNPLPFYPIARGEVINTGQSTINVTITANSAIVQGDPPQPLPTPETVTGIAPGATVQVSLTTGYNYTASANSTDTQDIELLDPDQADFTFNVD